MCGAAAAKLLVPKSLGRETIASCRRQEVLEVEAAKNGEMAETFDLQVGRGGALGIGGWTPGL